MTTDRSMTDLSWSEREEAKAHSAERKKLSDGGKRKEKGGRRSSATYYHIAGVALCFFFKIGTGTDHSTINCSIRCAGVKDDRLLFLLQVRTLHCSYEQFPIFD